MSEGKGKGMEYKTRVIREGKTYTFQCSCDFLSTGWVTKELASARGEGHSEEHATGEPGLELVEFRSKNRISGPTTSDAEVDA